jgi:hypothetical protein
MELEKKNKHFGLGKDEDQPKRWQVGKEEMMGNAMRHAQLLTHATEVKHVSAPSPLTVGLTSTFIDLAIKEISRVAAS